jgi:cystinosin
VTDSVGLARKNKVGATVWEAEASPIVATVLHYDCVAFAVHFYIFLFHCVSLQYIRLYSFLTSFTQSHNHTNMEGRAEAEIPLLSPQQQHDEPIAAPAQPSSVSSTSTSTAEEEDASSSSTCQACLALVCAPLTDDRGATKSLVAGLGTVVTMGALLGFVFPSNPALPPPWQRTSACVGYIYFGAWSISFYPQALSNRRRRTTAGVSVDFLVLNVLGFACYSAYNVALVTSPSLRQAYRERHDGVDIPVASNDVAFSLHALVLSMVTLGQVIYYDSVEALSHWLRRPSMLYLVCILLLWIGLVGPALVVYSDAWHWLDYLYMLSFIKVLISLVKYVPQVLLNVRRRSTAGWSIWQIVLDATGGLLSDVQLVGDTIATSSTPGSGTSWMYTLFTGNPAKLALGSLSLAFDVVFLLQHYVWYANAETAVLEDNAADDAGNDADNDDADVGEEMVGETEEDLLSLSPEEDGADLETAPAPHPWGMP